MLILFAISRLHRMMMADVVLYRVLHLVIRCHRRIGGYCWLLRCRLLLRKSSAPNCHAKSKCSGEDSFD